MDAASKTNHGPPLKAKAGRIHPTIGEDIPNLEKMVDDVDLAGINSHDLPADTLDQRPQLPLASKKYEAKSSVGGNTSNQSMTSRETTEVVSGLVYLVFTLILSFYYLTMLSPSMSNDLWWSKFNASGIQSHLIDVVNAQLNLGVNGSIDLTSNTYGIQKDYSQPYTPIEVSNEYPRLLLNSMSTDLAPFVLALRQISGPDFVETQYCWVDFNRKWEMAHTVVRQKRCKDRYIDNAAVYIEPVVRVFDWKTWIVTVYGGYFNTTIGNGLSRTYEGRQWLANTPYSFVNIDNEVAFWRKNGITRYTYQYINSFSWGVGETLSVQNAIGASQHITIKQMPYLARWGDWTTIYMYFGIWNDFPFCDYYQYSLLLNDPKHQRFASPCDYNTYLANPANYSCDPCDPALGLNSSNCNVNFEMFLNLADTPNFEMVHSNIGPLNSIDLYYVPPTPSLTKLFAMFWARMTQLTISNDAFAAAVRAIPTLKTDPIPPTWLNSTYMYIGGDPTCLSGQPTSFVQTSFAFDVVCTSQQSQYFLLTPQTTLFALWVTSTTSMSSVCTVCPTLKDTCTTVFGRAFEAMKIFSQFYPPSSNLFAPTIQAAYTDISAIGVSIIQFAIDTTDSSNHFLQQQMLKGQSAAQWDIFGWMYVFEWAQAQREVLSFEGDAAIIPLISNKYDPIVTQAQSLEVPKSSCRYLWVISVVVSSILVVVGVFVSFYGFLLRGRIVGRNIFQFNRVVGAVWLGRPFLMVRGMTAVILLSSSPTDFQAINGYTVLQFKPRNFFESMLVAGEATWISYVLQDFVLLMIRNSQPLFAPISTWIAWIIIVIIDSSSPYQVTTNMSQSCSLSIVDHKMKCTTGEVNIGSYNRAASLVIIQLLCVVIVFAVNKIWIYMHHSSSQSLNGHLLISGTASAFLHKNSLPNGAWTLDRATCVMCGLVTFSKTIFDLKLWVLVPDDTKKPGIKWNMKVFAPPDLNRALKDSLSEKRSSNKSSRTENTVTKRANRFIAFMGLMYMMATIGGSITYLSLTTTNMANDFWWANYNATREHAYMARLFNSQTIIRPKEGSVSFTDNKFIDDANYTISLATAVSVTMKPLYTAQVMSTDGSDLANVIHGLRVMDACLALWISAQYCWLDFGKKWEMANTAARQLRCANNYSSNAAVYLESVLRNVQWVQLRTCWGTSLDVAFGAPLSKIPTGASWWTSVQSVITSESDEMKYWQSFGLKSYATDWQNYKSIGIIDTFGVQNAFGLVYDMTLKYTNGSINLNSQTSLKMYWSFASDLWAITSPSTYMYGKSLIRQDPSFAFANVTMESVLVQNGTLVASDLTSGGAYSVVRSTFGPFGSIDLKRVPVPQSLLAFSLQLNDAIAQMRLASSNFSELYSLIPTLSPFGYFPPSWASDPSIVTTVGGNLLCNEVSPSGNVLQFTGAESACGSIMGEFIEQSPLSSLAATIGSNLARNNITSNDTIPICATIKVSEDSCPGKLISISAKLLSDNTLVSDPTLPPKLATLAQAAQKDVFSADVNIVQYAIRSPGTLVILKHNIFDPAYPTFHFAAWMLAMDWALAAREVISFQGDISTLNVLSASSNSAGSSVNPLEIPVNVAFYIRYVCLYVTSIIICVTILASVYLFLNKGYVEGLNLIEVNRVAGIVWIGRTFLFIRSIAAICLLSTQVLSLQPINNIWHMTSASDVSNESSTEKATRLFKTFLAAGEVSWLGFVLSDILMVYTAQYTPAYVFKCNFMVWGSAAILSWVSPVTHTATIQRQCTFAHVDYQFVCSSGTIAIGSFSRFTALVGICVGSIATAYLYERLRHPSLPQTRQDSLFLSSSAKYVYEPGNWMHHDVYYLDPASAVINGIMSIRYSNVFYMLDLKVWRIFVIEEPVEKRKKLELDGELHLLYAIPLSD